MNALFKRYPLALFGVGLIVFGAGPLFLAEVLRRLGLDSAIGFGLMWGLNFGIVFTFVGIIVFLLGLLKKG